jgi:hypothetical protein
MDTYTTQQLLTALLERTTFTNGLDFCSARDVLALSEALDVALAIPPLPLKKVLPALDLLQQMTYFVMLWHAEGKADDYEEYSVMRTEREVEESCLSMYLTPEEVADIDNILLTAF